MGQNWRNDSSFQYHLNVITGNVSDDDADWLLENRNALLEHTDLNYLSDSIEYADRFYDTPREQSDFNYRLELLRIKLRSLSNRNLIASLHLNETERSNESRLTAMQIRDYSRRVPTDLKLSILEYLDLKDIGNLVGASREIKQFIYNKYTPYIIQKYNLEDFIYLASELYDRQCLSKNSACIYEKLYKTFIGSSMCSKCGQIDRAILNMRSFYGTFDFGCENCYSTCEYCLYPRENSCLVESFIGDECCVFQVCIKCKLVCSECSKTETEKYTDSPQNLYFTIHSPDVYPNKNTQLAYKRIIYKPEGETDIYYATVCEECVERLQLNCPKYTVCDLNTHLH